MMMKGDGCLRAPLQYLRRGNLGIPLPSYLKHISAGHRHKRF